MAEIAEGGGGGQRGLVVGVDLVDHAHLVAPGEGLQERVVFPGADLGQAAGVVERGDVPLDLKLGELRARDVMVGADHTQRFAVG